MAKIIYTKGIDELSKDLKIARYYTWGKFERFIEDNTIWFSNVRHFKDNRERQIPEVFFNGWLSEQKDFYKGITNWVDDNVSAYISCWSKFDCENYALWKIYDPESTGVCLVTTVGELLKQISRDDLLICKVKYINPSDKNLKVDIPWVEYNSMFPFHLLRVKEKYKILPYKFEDEIRAIIYHPSDEKGIETVVSPSKLVKEIYLNPFMNKKSAETIKNKLEKNFSKSIISDSIIDEKL